MKPKVKEPETIIIRHGYEYHLVERSREGVHRDPNFFDKKGFALKSVNKVKHAD